MIEGGDHGFGGIPGIVASKVFGYKIMPQHAQIVRESLITFFDAHLREENSALTFLRNRDITKVFGPAARIKCLSCTTIPTDQEKDSCIIQ